MEIFKVKQQENVYLVNDTISVPIAPGNMHFRMVQEWLAVEGNNLEPQYTPAELAAKQAADERAAKEQLAQKYLNAGKAVIKEFHILNQGDDIDVATLQNNAQVFAGLKLYLDAGSSATRALIEQVDLTGTSLTEADKDQLLLVWDTAIA